MRNIKMVNLQLLRKKKERLPLKQFKVLMVLPAT